MFDFSKKKTSKQRTGSLGEDLAVEFLEKKGYKILERNWRSGRYEIDIIAEKRDCVSFIEVKTTSSDSAESFKLPCEAVDRKKRENIISAARAYATLRKKTIFDLTEDYRFDIIEVYLNREKPEINYLENAFYVEKGNKYNG